MLEVFSRGVFGGPSLEKGAGEKMLCFTKVLMEAVLGHVFKPGHSVIQRFHPELVLWMTVKNGVSSHEELLAFWEAGPARLNQGRQG